MFKKIFVVSLFKENKMAVLVLSKKFMLLMAFFCLSVFGTVTQVYGQSIIPPEIREYRLSAPENEILGIGMAKLVNGRNSMDLAELRARSVIVSQIYTKEISRAGDEVFNDLYQFLVEVVSTEASFEIMNDTRVVWAGETPDGTSWCLIAMYKSDARKYESIIDCMYDDYLSGLVY